MATRLPALFLGHGNPMNALEDNAWTRTWRALGTSLPRPEAILCISAHWYLPSTAVTAMPQPRTIHDFGGFPRALHEVQYPAPGAPELAARVARILDPIAVELNGTWGLDHGTWSVLKHVYPDADVPVVQLSINETKTTEWHYAMAQKLAVLREQGVLIVGSGNLVHNLHAYSWARRPVEPYDWAVRFETLARDMMLAANFAPLVGYEKLGEDALLAAPTPDHYLPLVYALAQYAEGDAVTFPVEGFDGGSISMLSVQLG
jgi:4,5-DOPA dioxygenase extradiol